MIPGRALSWLPAAGSPTEAELPALPPAIPTTMATGWVTPGRSSGLASSLSSEVRTLVSEEPAHVTGGAHPSPARPLSFPPPQCFRGALLTQVRIAPHVWVLNGFEGFSLPCSFPREGQPRHFMKPEAKLWKTVINGFTSF